MSDLSKVLGDLYGGDDQPSVAPPRNFRAEAPEWADDDRLDEAFADWTPGPTADAHRTEHEVVIDMPSVPAARLDDDLAATLSAALVDAGENDTEFPIASAPLYALPTIDEPALDYPAPMPLVDVEPMPAYEPEPEPVFVPEPVAAGPWSRANDDILPAKGAKAVKPVKVKGKGKSPKGIKEPKAPKLPKLGKVKGEKAHKASKPEKSKSESEPVKVFGIQLRRK